MSHNKRPYMNYNQSNKIVNNTEQEIVEEINESETVEETPAAEEIVEEVIEKEEEPVMSAIMNANTIAEPVVKVMKVNVPLLNVRVAPKATAKIAEQIRSGKEVNILGEYGEFVKIGDNRYVMAKFLI